MGTCLGKCFAGFDKRRKYLKTRYSVEKEASIEFENLMDDDAAQNEMSKHDLPHGEDRLVTERERELLSSRQYNALLHEQKRVDAEIDLKLQEQEEELRREEEAYYEAKREAARIARLQKAKEQEFSKSGPSSNHSRSWPGDSEWEVGGGEDDFEMFLANVKARSLKATAHLRKGSNEGQSSNSSSTNTPQNRDRSHTEGSSMELEWEHEDGVIPVQRKPRSSTEENLVGLANRKTDSPALSNDDYEWDTEFIASEDHDTQELLASDFSTAQQSFVR